MKSPSEPAELRKRAEQQLAAREARAAGAAGKDPARLVHELEVHQIELEMQNDELRTARYDLETALASYTELFDFVPVGYVVLAESGAIRQLNLECAHMLGAPRGELTDKRFSSFVEPYQRSIFDTFLARTLTAGRADGSQTCELSLLARGGARYEVSALGVPAAGPVPTALVALKDVTERKRAEAALRDEANRKDEFLAALSHELRNPLSPIRSSLVVLDRAEPGGDEARSALAIMHRQVDHLVHIVDDLLDVTRIARNRISLQKERLALRDLVRAAVDDNRAEFDAARIALQTRLGARELWVEADPTRLAQVVGNLLANALKFTRPGGHVDVALRSEGEQAVLSVRDDGVGIAPEMRDRLFEPFVQAPQTLDRTPGGLGLGLAMVKGIVELHGGTVRVESAGRGRGSEFTVRLPQSSAGATAAPPSAKKQAHVGRRVLVIEDSVDAADCLSMLLAMEGNETVVAHDGATGLALARDFHPEVVLCDIGLPEMDGYEVARAMRADASLGHPYLVALSGYARPEDRERSLSAGFDRHVAKPPSTDELEQIIASAPPLSR